MTFAEPAWLYVGLVATVVTGAFLWWTERRKLRRLEGFAASKLLPSLTSNYSGKKTFLRCMLLTLIVLMLFVTIARPQWGSRQRETAPTGIDVLVALDVSRSMLARDIRPNRIERVKLGLSNLLDKVKGDRIGLIAFAGSSFLQCPLTLDHSSVRRTLREMQVGVIKRQGTDFALPIEAAMDSFSKDDRDRFLIIISDGEDLERRGLKKAKIAAKEGVRIYTIGIGNKEGARIPLNDFDKPARDFLKDINGKPVMTKMDEANLVSIANATGGKYYSLGPAGEGLVKVVEELQAIGQQKRHTLLTEELPIERFTVFLFIAIVLLLGEFFLGNRRNLHKLGSSAALILAFIFSGCLRNENIKQAEEAHEKKEYAQAATFYETELNATLAAKNKVDPRLYLNTGLAHLEASNLRTSKAFLEKALDESLDQPELQSTILNALGNLHYANANLALDTQDVITARQAWKKALENYDSAIALDGNPKARENRENLRVQLEERIETLISRISGIVWRDIDGNGRPQAKEPRLLAKVYWDKNEDGEHNASSEPFVSTDASGRYSIEWISGSYPVSFKLGSVLSDQNASNEHTLIPILPPPAPPLRPDHVMTQEIRLTKASNRQVPLPYRAAPVLKGFIWNDTDQDGKRDSNETGYTKATLFLDLDGNLNLDENETSFKPSENGDFAQAVPPGKHVLGISIESESSAITFPKEKVKAHLTFVDFETTAEHLNFGIHDPNQQNKSEQDPDPVKSDGNPQQNEQDNKDQESTAQNQQHNIPRDVNALYKRLLQEADANAEPLDPEGKISESSLKGRDY